MAEFVGSSGTLVGAALETAGYYYQSWLLDALGDPGIHSVGALLYVIGAIVAVTTFVVSGNFKLGGWFFLGPGLFFSVILPRQETAGSDWQFGGEPRNRQQLEEQYKELTYGGESYTPKVSKLFAAYNDLVSSSVRDIVATLNGERERVDLKFLFRSQLYAYMVSPTIKEPGFRELLHLGLLGRCRELVEAGREMADAANGDTVQAQYREKYDRLKDERVMRISGQSARYLASFKTDYPSVFQTVYVTSPDQEILNQLSGCHEPGGSCPAPPGDVTEAVNSIKAAEEQWRATHGDTPINPDDPQFLALKAELDQRAAERAQAAAELEASLFPCHDIWNFVFIGLNVEAVKTVENAIRMAREQRQLTEEDVQQLLTSVFAQGDEQQVYRVIAKRLLSNEFYRGSVSSVIADYAEKSTRIRALGVTEDSPLSATERARTGNRAWAERTKMMASAASLPYYQGLALYFLAVAYPFFAFLLLIPGKHAGFFLWFALWFWVKSWDIGFAAVMLLDDALFSLFVVNNNPGDDPRARQLSNDLSVAILSLREGDPSFALSTYYSIIAIALHAIPMVTSYLILGGVTGGVGLIAAGRGRWSGVSGGSFGSGGGLSQAAQMGQSQFEVDSSRQQAFNSLMNRARLYQDWARSSSGGIGEGGIGSADQNTPYGERLSNEGVGNRKGTVFGLTGGQMVEGAARASYAAGIADGSRTTVMGKVNPLNWAGSRRQLNRVRDGIADAGEILGDTTREVLLTLASDRYNVAEEWAKYDGWNSREVQDLAARGRNYDMFEIPWTSPWTTTAGGWYAEFKQYLHELQGAAKLTRAGAQAAGALIDAYGEGRGGRGGRGSLMGTGAAAGIMGLGLLNDALRDDELIDPLTDAIRAQENPGGASPLDIDASNLTGRRTTLLAPDVQGAGGDPAAGPGAPSAAPGGPSAQPGAPEVAYWMPGTPGGGSPRAEGGSPQTAYGTPDYGRGGDPYYDRGGDPYYGRGIRRIQPVAIDALEAHEARLAAKADAGKLARGKVFDTRLAYGDPNVEATEAHVTAAHERLEEKVAELRLKGVTGPELEEAERLLEGFHSAEGAYDAAAAKLETVDAARARKGDTKEG